MPKLQAPQSRWKVLVKQALSAVSLIKFYPGMRLFKDETKRSYDPYTITGTILLVLAYSVTLFAIFQKFPEIGNHVVSQQQFASNKLNMSVDLKTEMMFKMSFYFDVSDESYTLVQRFAEKYPQLFAGLVDPQKAAKDYTLIDVIINDR